MSINTHTTHNLFLSIPGEVIPHIFKRLTIKCLLQFECVCSQHYSLTKHVWSYKRQEARFEFNWSFLENHSHPDKWSYVLPYMLKRHCQAIAEAKRKSQNVKIDVLYWKQHFPLFGCYINHDAHQLVEVDKPADKAELEQMLAAKTAEKKWGGDLLLQGLFKVQELSLDSEEEVLKRVFDCFEEAIAKKATLACRLVLEVAPQFALSDWHERLALAAAKQKDYSALEDMLAIAAERAQILFDQGHALAPIQASLGHIQMDNKQWGLAHTYYQAALGLYGDQAPAHVWGNAAVAYIKNMEEIRKGLREDLKKEDWNVAEHLLIQALDKWKDQEPLDVNKACAVFKEMKQIGLKAGHVTYRSLIDLFVKKEDVTGACDILTEMKQRRIGCEPYEEIYICLFNLCVKKEDEHKAIAFFDEMVTIEYKPDKEIYQSLINLYLKKGNMGNAYWFHKEMVRLQYKPDKEIYQSLINAFLKVEHVKGRADILFAEMLKMGYQPDEEVYTSFIHFFMKKEDANEAKKFVEMMRQRGFKVPVEICTSLINLCARKADVNKAYNIFEEMKSMELKLDEMTCHALIDLLVKKEALQQAQAVFTSVFSMQDYVKENTLDIRKLPQQAAFIVLSIFIHSYWITDSFTLITGTSLTDNQDRRLFLLQKIKKNFGNLECNREESTDQRLVIKKK